MCVCQTTQVRSGLFFIFKKYIYIFSCWKSQGSFYGDRALGHITPPIRNINSLDSFSKQTKAATVHTKLLISPFSLVMSMLFS